ncbi:MAG TPA: heavy-metal-associated domain-containing protein [Gammaproteobacteria bacterium]|jgi:copper chaperone|nr:heavy-metal-associated domain-containing protein [Gammaproteobacteria bacterium]
MQHVIDVENIRCGGCANTIGKTLRKINGVESVDVDIENGRVTVEAGDDSRELLVRTLLSRGYPENGSAEGIKAATAKAKSFVSCAIGKVS